MQSESSAVSVGDWVYCDSPGVWQVYRILEGVERLKYSLKEQKAGARRARVFCKRLVDEAWNPGFAAEVSKEGLVRALGEADERRLEAYLEQSPGVIQAFEAFEPGSLDLMWNLRLNVPDRVGKGGIRELAGSIFSDIGAGLTNQEVLMRIDSSQLAGYVSWDPANAAIGFCCKNHEVRNNAFVFRGVSVFWG